ncbi:MAG: hypothetical protein KBD21_00030 [Candidatus Pacebacteria bacterium]|nr:hypothetical protein [Candidatus Paceibacterota bacterium]
MPPRQEEQTVPAGEWVPQKGVSKPLPYAYENMAPESAHGEQPSSSGYIPLSDTGDEQYSHPGWSWAGFFWFIPFIIAIRKYKYLFWALMPVCVLFVAVVVWLIFGLRSNVGSSSMLVLLVSVAFLFAVLFLIGFPFYIGLKGRELAATSTTFTNKEQYIGFMKAFDHGAMVAFFAMLALWVLGIVVSSVFFGFGTMFDVDGVDTYGAQAAEAMLQFRNVILN